jgi:hypothetical protein
LRALLENGPPGASDFQDVAYGDIVKAGLPGPQRNRIVAGYERDLVWPDQKVAAELDGYRFHGTRAAFEHDRENDAALHGIGWVVFRISRRQFTVGRQRTLNRLHALLLSRSGAPSAAPAARRSAS